MSGAAAGFHLLLSLTGCPAPAVVEEAARRDVRLADLDDYRMVRTSDSAGPTLVLGYGNLADRAVPDAVRRLAQAVGAARRTNGRDSEAGRAKGRPG
ncbi:MULTISPECIES: hypothetical protein [unclassified Streptomyces]|uniref:hypothetical protein n=1 Tax=unclassified Streptomyces TaxID=2593676 RepID=UPI00234B3355|nr:hypothetical protein [Streptomyces sp. M92]WCN05037.1 hypothetical protein M6G08_24560 [Streptomyces sp. M92]